MLELIQSQLFFFLVEYKFFPFQLVLELLPLSLQRSNLLVSFFFNFRPLLFQLSNFFLQVRNGLLIDLLIVGFLFLQFILNFLHFFLFDDVGFVQLSNLLLLIIDCLHLLLSLLSQLLELLLHSTDLASCLFVLIASQGFFLRFPDFL
jgi:hypothetical protein